MVSIWLTLSGFVNVQESPAEPAQPEPEEIQAKGMETSPTGNSVVLEEQLIKVSETQIQYSMLTNLYRKQADMLRMAIGRR